MVIVLALVFGESAVLLDFFVPGEVGLVVAGAAAAHNDTSLPGVVAAATIGAVAGDSVGYGLGRRFGTDIAEHGRFARWLKPGLDRARRHFDRRGGQTVALARFVGALRAAVPVVAGSARMPYPVFLAWALPAALVWSVAVSTVGYVWGDDIAGVVDRAGLAISAVVVAVIVVLAVRAHRRRRAAPGGEPEAGGPSPDALQAAGRPSNDVRTR
jgi:membrane protein DedA with SNARE-associated domain